MKKIIIISAIFIFAAAIGIGIYSSQNTTKGSDLLRQNIEGMGQGKYGDQYGKRFFIQECVITIVVDGELKVIGTGNLYECDYNPITSKCESGCIQG